MISESMAETKAYPDSVLPGTTIPNATPNGQNGSSGHSHTSAPITTPGPLIYGKPTTLTMYEPAQLADFPYLASLQSMMNTSFTETFRVRNILTRIKRLRTPTQFLDEVGTDPGTFTYILSATDAPAEILATVSAHRYVQPVLMAQADADAAGTNQYSAFVRFDVPACAQDDDEWAVDVWELKVMAVAREAQRHGIAGMLMRAVDEEAKVRFRRKMDVGATSGADGAERGKRHRCVMLLSTVNEQNQEFYERKGYECGSSRKFPAGYLDSASGFTVGHFSKVLEEI